MVNVQEICDVHICDVRLVEDQCVTVFDSISCNGQEIVDVFRRGNVH